MEPLEYFLSEHSLINKATGGQARRQLVATNVLENVNKLFPNAGIYVSESHEYTLVLNKWFMPYGVKDLAQLMSSYVKSLDSNAKSFEIVKKLKGVGKGQVIF